MSDLRQQIIASLRPGDIDTLSDEVILALARRLGPLLSEASPAPETDGWVDFDGALEHLGMKKGTLYKLTSARTIPFHRHGPGSNWFRRSELDEWRLAGALNRAQSRSSRPPFQMDASKMLHEAILAVLGVPAEEAKRPELAGLLY